MTTWVRSYPIVAYQQYEDRKGDNVEILPEWEGRRLLAQAVAAEGLPWVPWAVWRRPREAMTYNERLQAVAVAGRVIAEARRRLPPGVSGAAIDRQWRDAAWRCTVAGLALLDADAREQLASGGDDALEAHAGRREPEPEAVHPVAVPLRREPTVPMPARRSRFRIHREGEVPRAS